MNVAILLSAPAGAGKTTALDRLQRLVGSSHRLAIVDRETIANMVGHHVTTPNSEHHFAADAISWYSSLAQAGIFIRNGYDVVVASPVSDHEISQFRRSLPRSRTIAVLLLPPWESIQRQRAARVSGNLSAGRQTSELGVLPPDEHRQSYEHQKSMADRGLFDVVIDEPGLTPEDVANRILDVLASTDQAPELGRSTGLALQPGPPTQ